MSTTREAAAFHEAGHCYVAVRLAGRVVESMSINRDDEGWAGKTSIQPDRQVGRNAQAERESDSVLETNDAMRAQSLSGFALWVISATRRICSP